MASNSHKKVIIVTAAVLILGGLGAFLYFRNKQAAAAAAAGPAGVVPGTAGASAAGSGTPSPLGGSTPTTPVAALLGAGGSGSGAGTAAVNLPAGFQSWFNSLGPQNQAHLQPLLATMPSADINLVDNIVTNNLWGQASVAGQWNAFTQKYGLPVGGRFSSFSGVGRI